MCYFLSCTVEFQGRISQKKLVKTNSDIKMSMWDPCQVPVLFIIQQGSLSCQISPYCVLQFWDW